MDKYPISAKPTLYKDRLYRSRLEARWACMFDFMGWQYEYEPFDLNGWSPDFLVKGCAGDILVEVKPGFLIGKDVIIKAQQALTREMDFHFLLLNESPFIVDCSWGCNIKLGIGIQCTTDFSGIESEGYIGKFSHEYTTEFYMKSNNDFSSQEGYWDGMIFNKVDRKYFMDDWDPDFDWLQKHWQLAANKTMFLNPVKP